MSFIERYKWRSLAAVHASRAYDRADAAGPKHPPLKRQTSDQDRAEAGDRVRLPPAALGRLMDMFGDNPLPSPLTFELQYKGSKCFVGVQEFSSEDGVITLPKSVITALALDRKKEMDAVEKVAIKYIKLPKARKVVIQPFTADFLDIPDHKAFMESGLTHNFTLLYKEQIIVLRHEGQQFPLIIRELEPASAPACVILNTDCIMETLAPVTDGTAAGEDPTRRAIQFLKPNEPVSGWAPEGKYVYYGFSLPYQVNPETVDVRVTVTNADHKAAVDASIADAPPPLTAAGGSGVGGKGATTTGTGEAMDISEDDGDVSVGLTRSLSSSSSKRIGDTDAYISVHPVRKPTITNHVWALNAIGGGSIVLKPETEDIVQGESAVTKRSELAPVPVVTAPVPAPAPAPVAAVGAVAAAGGGTGRAVSPAPVAQAGGATLGGGAPAATGTGKSVVELAAEGKLTQAEIAARVAAALGKAGLPGPAPTAAPTPAPAPSATGGAAGGAGGGPALKPTASPTIGSLLAASKAPRTWYIGVTGYKGRAVYTITITVSPRGTADGGEGATAAVGGAGATAPLGVEIEPSIPIPAPDPAQAAATKSATPARSVSPAAGASGATNATSVASGGGEDHTGQKLCPHCGSWVRETNYALHSAQCARNNVKCPFSGCGAILRKAPDAFDVHWHCPECTTVMHRHVGGKHTLLHHALHECQCGVKLTLQAMRKHTRDTCPYRQVICRFCSDTVRAGETSGMDPWDRMHGLTPHEAYCGSRTAACKVCKEKVPLKRYEEHFFVRHPTMEVQPPAPETIEASSSGAWGTGGATGGGTGGGSRADSPEEARPITPRWLGDDHDDDGRPSSPPAPTGPALPRHWQRVWACSICSFYNTLPSNPSASTEGLTCTICTTPLTADIPFKFVDSSKDQAEVSAEEMFAAGFAPDGSALPADMRPATTAATTPSAAVITPQARPATTAPEPAKAWSCSACTYENEASRTKCAVCDTAKPKAAPAPAPAPVPAPAPASSPFSAARAAFGGFGGTGTGSGRSTSAAAPAPVVASLCRNQVCGNTPAKGTGAAASLGVCERCLDLMTDDGAIGTEELTDSLMSKYGAQIKDGCGNAVCRNMHCATGKANITAAEPPAPAPTPAPAPAPAPAPSGFAAVLAGLGLGGSSPAPAPVPPQHPVLARAVSSSDELMACMMEANLFSAHSSTPATSPFARITARYYICVPDKQRLQIKGTTALAQRIASVSGGAGASSASVPAASGRPTDDDEAMDTSSPSASSGLPASTTTSTAAAGDTLFSAPIAGTATGVGGKLSASAGGTGAKSAFGAVGAGGKKPSDRVAGAFFP